MKKTDLIDKIENNRKYNTINVPKCSNKAILNIFANTLINNFKDEDLTNLYNNINEVTIKNYVKDENDPYQENVLARYESFGNTLEVSPGRTDTLYHELFHLASSSGGLDDGTALNGFSQSHIVLTKLPLDNAYIRKIVVCGIGLDEVYTQLMAERYFYNKSLHQPSPATNYVLYIEGLIGKDKMQSHYLNADLKSFVNDLSKYACEKDVLNLIDALDSAYYLSIHPYILKDKSISNKYELYLKKVAYLTSTIITQYALRYFDETGVNLFEKLREIPTIRFNHPELAKIVNHCDSKASLGGLNGVIKAKLRIK